MTVDFIFDQSLGGTGPTNVKQALDSFAAALKNLGGKIGSPLVPGKMSRTRDMMKYNFPPFVHQFDRSPKLNNPQIVADFVRHAQTDRPRNGYLHAHVLSEMLDLSVALQALKCQEINLDKMPTFVVTLLFTRMA